MRKGAHENPMFYIPIANSICSCSDSDDGSTRFRLAHGDDVTWLFVVEIAVDDAAAFDVSKYFSSNLRIAAFTASWKTTKENDREKVKTSKNSSKANIAPN